MPSSEFLRGLAYAGLLAFGLWLRVSGFDPPSLWNDDEWPAIAVREMTLGEFLELRPPLPIGFRFVQQLAAGLSPDPEWPLQLVPLAASLLQALLAGYLAGRLCRDRWIGLVAGAWALVTPVWVEYAVRVKQYASDGFVTVAILALAVRAWQEPSPARVALLLVAGVAALALSFPAVFVVAPALAITLWLPETRRLFARRGLQALLLAVAVAGALLLLFMQGQSGDSMHAAWTRRGGFLSGDASQGVWRDLAGFGWSALTGGFPPALPFLALGVGAGALGLALSRDRAGRAALALVGGLFAGLVAASAAGIYPLDTGRVAAFHRPLGPVLLAVGLHGALRWLPRAGPVRAIAIALAALAALPFAERSGYRASDDAVAARAVVERLGPDDTVVTFLRSVHALGYYTPGPHAIVAEPRLGCRFVARLAHPRTHYLWLGSKRVRASTQEIDAQLSPVLAAASDRIVYVPPRFGDRAILANADHVLGRIREAGYEDVEGAAGSRFVRVLARGGAPTLQRPQIRSVPTPVSSSASVPTEIAKKVERFQARKVW